MPSDCGQDKFVLDTLNNKRNGYWLELGCQGPISSSNTQVLELEYNWKGISIDINQSYIDQWAGVRNTDMLFCANALLLNYEELLEKLNAPKEIDYLSIDLEPPPVTFAALDKIPFHKYKFKVITFEHDHYRQDFLSFDLKNKSQKFFNNLGYKMVPENIINSYHSNISLAESWYTLND